MKNIYEILKGIEIEIPEEKKADFETELSANYKTIAEHTKLQTARDNLEQQLTTAQEALKSFEGVDVSELQGKIATLQSDLSSQAAAHKAQLDDMQFDSMLSDEIKTIGGRSEKAIKAELDIEVLKKSKNQKEDILSALNACREKNDFLFGANEPINNPITGKSSQTGISTNDDAIRAVMGLPPTNKN